MCWNFDYDVVEDIWCIMSELIIQARHMLQAAKIQKLTIQRKMMSYKSYEAQVDSFIQQLENYINNDDKG